VSSHPPLPPVARIPEVHVHADDQPATIPGWVGGLIYLACLIVLTYTICTRML
jgi:hypothetical protein